jgi:hypothetical protein
MRKIAKCLAAGAVVLAAAAYVHATGWFNVKAVNNTHVGMTLHGTADGTAISGWVPAGGSVVNLTPSLADIPGSVSIQGPSNLNGGHGFSCGASISGDATRVTVSVSRNNSGVYYCQIFQRIVSGGGCPTPGHPCP